MSSSAISSIPTPGRTPAERSISPPSPFQGKRRKVESATTKSVVANFFKPASEREPPRMRWSILHDTVIVGHYRPDAATQTSVSHYLPSPSNKARPRTKLACFDLDSTLITTSSGATYARNASDWKWWHSNVPKSLRDLHANGYRIAIMSNQGSIALGTSAKNKKKAAVGEQRSFTTFKTKLAAVLAQFDFPIVLLAATARDGYRKPRTGMWKDLLDTMDLDQCAANNALSEGPNGRADVDTTLSKDPNGMVDVTTALPEDPNQMVSITTALPKDPNGTAKNTATDVGSIAKSTNDPSVAVNAILGAPLAPESSGMASTRQECAASPIQKDGDDTIDTEVDFIASFYVGDAAGRKSDHSCCDRDLAANIGIKFYTPEQFFLQDTREEAYTRTFDPKAFLATQDQQQATENIGSQNGAIIADVLGSNIGNDDRRRNEAQQVPIEKGSAREIVVFVGGPGSGKSTFYARWLAPQGYVRVNQDQLGTRDRCVRRAEEALAQGSSVAIDNTNADLSTRGVWLGLGKKFGVPVRCVHFLTEVEVCRHNDAVRGLIRAVVEDGGDGMGKRFNPEGRAILPHEAFRGFEKRYHRPDVAEGFQDLITVDFVFKGGREERMVWAKYWV